jgi:hypothetical protein
LHEHVPCITCGYDLFGLDPAGKCPECGGGVGQSVEMFRNRQIPFLATLRSLGRLWGWESLAWVVAMVCLGGVALGPDELLGLCGVVVAMGSIVVAGIVRGVMWLVAYRLERSAPSSTWNLMHDGAQVLTLALFALFVVCGLGVAVTRASGVPDYVGPAFLVAIFVVHVLGGLTYPARYGWYGSLVTRHLGVQAPFLLIGWLRFFMEGLAMVAQVAFWVGLISVPQLFDAFAGLLGVGCVLFSRTVALVFHGWLNSKLKPSF